MIYLFIFLKAINLSVGLFGVSVSLATKQERGKEVSLYPFGETEAEGRSD